MIQHDFSPEGFCRRCQFARAGVRAWREIGAEIVGLECHQQTHWQFIQEYMQMLDEVSLQKSFLTAEKNRSKKQT